MTYGPITSWQIDGETMETVTLFSWAPKSLQMVTAAINLKDTCSLEENLWPTQCKWKSLSHIRLFETLWTIQSCNSPGQNTEVGSHSILQGIFPTQGLNPGFPHCRQILYQQSHKGSPKILELVVHVFSSGSSWPGMQPGLPALQADSLAIELSGYNKPREDIKADITLPAKVCIVKAIVFSVVMYGCDSWTIKSAECWRTDAFVLWCWRRFLRVPWTARRSNQSILKEISPRYSLEGVMLKHQFLATWWEKLIHWTWPWCWEKLKAGEGDDRGWDGWKASPTQWTWVRASSESWWWAVRPGMLQSMGSQNWTWLSDWTERKKDISI